MDSYLNHECFHLKSKVIRLLTPYCFATVIYVVYDTHFLDANFLFQRLIHFDVRKFMYYVAVYLQLLVMTPVLIRLINYCGKKNRLIRMTLAYMVIILVGYLSARYTNLFDISKGGNYIFAGIWLVFWYTGMIIRYIEKDVVIDLRVQKAILILLTVLIVCWEYVFVLKEMNLALPNVYHGDLMLTWANALETVIIFFWFKLSMGMVEKSRLINKLFIPLDNIGKHTYYIFLYNAIFIDVYLDYLQYSQPLANRISFLLFIILAPIALEIALKKSKSCFHRMMESG